jgi:hypothetical protein
MGAKQLAEMRKRLGRILALPDKIEPSGRVIREPDYRGTHAVVTLTQSGDGVEIPAVFFPVAGGGSHPLMVYVKEGDSAANVCNTIVPLAHGRGMSVLWVDCRGWGETAHAEGIIARDGVFLGEPILGQRVRDVLGAIGYFATRPEVDAKKIAICGCGLSGSLVALYAGALDTAIATVAVDACPASYLDIFDVDSVGMTHIMAVPDVLSVADIAQTAGLVVPRKLWLGLAKGSSPDRLGAWRAHLADSGVTISDPASSTPESMIASLAGH